MTEISKKPDSNVDRIRRQTRRLVREMDVVRGIYLDSGYTFSQCHILFELAQHGPLNLTDLANQLLIDKSNTSRTLKTLVDLGLIKATVVQADNRQKKFSLTKQGKKALQSITGLANRQVSGALENLTDGQQEIAIEGMRLYAGALRNNRLQADCVIREIRKSDNSSVADLIRAVMTEFKALGAGYSAGDPEVDDMHGSYRGSRSCFRVVVRNDRIVGCGGIAPLSGGSRTICELRKMFFMPAIRGMGLGRRLLLQLLDEARSRRYKQCYLETLVRMERANELYRRNGFKLLDNPLGSTGHCSCDRWYLLEL